MTSLPAVASALLLLILLSSCCSAPKPPVDSYEHLTISGVIDGSEKFIFTPEQVKWVHLHWSEPDDMTFKGKPWNNPRKTPAQWADFAHLDLPHARIVQRQGRDVVALEPTASGFVLYLVDSPNGADNYSVTIAIPKQRKK
jgi:hypothetical protein